MKIGFYKTLSVDVISFGALDEFIFVFRSWKIWGSQHEPFVLCWHCGVGTNINIITFLCNYAYFLQLKVWFDAVFTSSPILEFIVQVELRLVCGGHADGMWRICGPYWMSSLHMNAFVYSFSCDYLVCMCKEQNLCRKTSNRKEFGVPSNWLGV